MQRQVYIKDKINNNIEPSVAIVLINWNNYPDTKKCLSSLIACTYKNFKVVVVDNNSTDGSREKLKAEFSHFAHFIFNESNLGFSGGNNVGFRYALSENFEYVMELNNDTEVEPDFLTNLVYSIHNKSEYAAAQPLIFYNGNNRDIIWNAGGRLINSLGLSLTNFEGKKISNKISSRETEWITGCAFLVKSEVMKKVGLLREFYFFGSFEDVDYSVRIKALNYKLWLETSAVIYHSVGQSMINKEKGKEGNVKPFAHYLTQRNQMIYIKQNTKIKFLPLAIAYQFLKMIIFSSYFVARFRFEKLVKIWQGFWDGLINTYAD